MDKKEPSGDKKPEQPESVHQGPALLDKDRKQPNIHDEIRQFYTEDWTGSHSSSSGEDQDGKSEQEKERKSSDPKRKSKVSKKSPGPKKAPGRKRASGGEELDTAKTTKDAATDPDDMPAWVPLQWRPPKGYTGWVQKDGEQDRRTSSTPNMPMPFQDEEESDWLKAFDIVKNAEKDPDELARLKNLLNGSPSEDEEPDPMERLPRETPSRREYPKYDFPPEFQYYRSYPLYPTISTERYYEWYKDISRLKDPTERRKSIRPVGPSRSAEHIDWNDPKEASKWHSYGYRRPATKPKPQRPDFDTRDYVYDNARSTVIQVPRKVVPKYIDDRNGTSHFLEPSGLAQKYVKRNDYGTIPPYLMSRNQELGRPPIPDMDKFYEPHRCKVTRDLRCKICRSPVPTTKHVGFARRICSLESLHDGSTQNGRSSDGTGRRSDGSNQRNKRSDYSSLSKSHLQDEMNLKNMVNRMVMDGEGNNARRLLQNFDRQRGFYSNENSSSELDNNSNGGSFTSFHGTSSFTDTNCAMFDQDQNNGAGCDNYNNYYNNVNNDCNEYGNYYDFGTYNNYPNNYNYDCSYY